MNPSITSSLPFSGKNKGNMARDGQAVRSAPEVGPELPPEVLLVLFEIMSKERQFCRRQGPKIRGVQKPSTYLTCLKVSKQWHAAGVTILYRDIVFRSEGAVVKFNDCVMERKTNLQILTRSLTLQFERNREEAYLQSTRHLNTRLMLFHNLQYLSIRTLNGFHDLDMFTINFPTGIRYIELEAVDERLVEDRPAPCGTTHICSSISRLMPQFEGVRIRHPYICDAIVPSQSYPRLKTLVLNLMSAKPWDQGSEIRASHLATKLREMLDSGENRFPKIEKMDIMGCMKHLPETMGLIFGPDIRPPTTYPVHQDYGALTRRNVLTSETYVAPFGHIILASVSRYMHLWMRIPSTDNAEISDTMDSFPRSSLDLINTFEKQTWASTVWRGIRLPIHLRDNPAPEGPDYTWAVDDLTVPKLPSRAARRAAKRRLLGWERRAGHKLIEPYIKSGFAPVQEMKRIVPYKELNGEYELSDDSDTDEQLWAESQWSQ